MKIKNLIFILSITILLANTSFALANTTNETLTKQYTITKDNEENFIQNMPQVIVENDIEYKLTQYVNTGETYNEKEIVQNIEKTGHTDKKDEILSYFDTNIDYEDSEYKGVLNIQIDSLKINLIDNGKRQELDVLNKEFNDLTETDLNNIPKTVIHNDIEYQLTFCEWTPTKTELLENNIEIYTLYKAQATYKAIIQKQQEKTYNYVVQYNGKVTSKNSNTVTYECYYQSTTPIVEPELKQSNTLPYIISISTGSTIVIVIILIRFCNNATVVYAKDNKEKKKRIKIKYTNPKIVISKYNADNKITLIFDKKTFERLRGKILTVITNNRIYEKMILNHDIILDKE